MLKISPEPVVDPANVDIATLHVARLDLVQLESIDDRKLNQLYGRIHHFRIIAAIEAAGNVLVNRPDSIPNLPIDPFDLYVDLAMLAAERGQNDRAIEWLRLGRQRDPIAKRASNAPKWDMIEIRLKAITSPPEAWVQDLAAVMERYAANNEANGIVISALAEMGLVRVQPKPDRPNEVTLDSRPLQSLMAMYGPRVTTASGQLGVAAGRGEIWTPGSESGAGGGSGLWTPGSSEPPAPGGGEKSKLIIPGR
jgi:hypothetical protein